MRKIGSRTFQARFIRASASSLIPNAEGRMRVAELMQRKVTTIAADATVAEAILNFADRRISGLLIEATPVQEIMTPRPCTITAQASVHEAAQQMLYADVDRLFVTDGDQVVGVISTTDIMRAVGHASIALG